jgi:hypothetical protein
MGTHGSCETRAGGVELKSGKNREKKGNIAGRVGNMLTAVTLV